MSTRTLTLRATNAAGFVEASANVTMADPPPSGGNIIEQVGTNLLSDCDPDPQRLQPYAGHGGQNGYLSTTGMAFSPFYGTLGALAFVGGGHADYGGNESYVFEFDTMTWKRINNPTTAPFINMVTAGVDPPGLDYEHGELADGNFASTHGYDTTTVIPGGTKGLLLRHSGLALSWNGGYCTGWSHVVDLETGQRSRFSTNRQPGSVDSTGKTIQAAHATTYDAVRGRVWGVPRGGFHNLFSYLDLATKAHVQVTFGMSNIGYNPCATQHPVGNLMLMVTGIGNYNQSHICQLCAIDLTNTAAGLIVLKTAGDQPATMLSPCYAIDWDTDNDVGYIFSANSTYDGPTSGENGAVYKVTPPADRINGTWQLTRIALPTPMPVCNTDGSYSRWRYIPTLKKFAYVPTNRTKVQLWTPPQ